MIHCKQVANLLYDQANSLSLLPSAELKMSSSLSSVGYGVKAQCG